MSETVPLGGLLGIEVIFIVEGVVGGDPFDAVFEAFTTESCRYISYLSSWKKNVKKKW